MIIPSKLFSRIFVLAASATLAFALTTAASEPPKLKSITTDGITFSVPETWKAGTPKGMRKAQIAIPETKGDSEPGEFTVYAFPGGAGSVEANIKRWEGFFVDDEGKSPKAEPKKVKGKNVEVVKVELSGKYVAPKAPGSTEKFDKPNFRFFGAIVETDDGTYYLRAVGPDKTMKAAAEDFDKMLESIEAKK